MEDFTDKLLELLKSDDESNVKTALNIMQGDIPCDIQRLSPYLNHYPDLCLDYSITDWMLNRKEIFIVNTKLEKLHQNIGKLINLKRLYLYNNNL